MVGAFENVTLATLRWNQKLRGTFTRNQKHTNNQRIITVSVSLSCLLTVRTGLSNFRTYEFTTLFCYSLVQLNVAINLHKH